MICGMEGEQEGCIVRLMPVKKMAHRVNGTRGATCDDV